MKSYGRAKYGEPETRKQLMLRLKEERETLQQRKQMEGEIKNKNKLEFHFSYYSVTKDMVKNKKLKLDELKKALRYIDSEISRVEKKIQSSMEQFKCKKIVFDNEIKIKKDLCEPTRNDLKEYIEQMKLKREEIIEKIKQRKEEK